MSRSVEPPLCIDCDGSLLRTDLLHEAVFLLLTLQPWRLLWLPFWLLRGKAYLKARVFESARFDWATLPLNDAIVQLAREARATGRRVLLVTASHRRAAAPLAEHLGLFDEVIATDDASNLSGTQRADRLVERFGEKGFDYVGNSRTDLAVWAVARRATVVSNSAALADAARQVSSVERVIDVPRPRPADYLRAWRLHQWLKNLLVFVPVVAAHQDFEAGPFIQAALAFLAFGLCASSVYALNDLLDLASDRRHVRKCRRPFASGLIPVSHGAVSIPLLLAAGIAVASLLPGAFLLMLLVYFALTLAYSLLLKRQVVVDVLMLAGLYTLRVVAGGAATGIVPSFWLLAFSMFIFLSLALVKRYSELLVTLSQSKRSVSGRGYRVDDLPVLMSAGTSSGMVAVLVFALYINTPEVHRNYTDSRWLWLVPPLLLYWVSRLWMKAHRGEVDDDPVVFAIKDWQSLMVLGLSALLFVLA